MRRPLKDLFGTQTAEAATASRKVLIVHCSQLLDAFAARMSTHRVLYLPLCTTDWPCATDYPSKDQLEELAQYSARREAVSPPFPAPLLLCSCPLCLLLR